LFFFLSGEILNNFSTSKCFAPKDKLLVGGLEHLDYLFHILGMSSSQLIFIFLRGVGIPPTRLFWARNLLYWFIIPTDFHIFGRGRYTTNQVVLGKKLAVLVGFPSWPSRLRPPTPEFSW